MSLVNLSYDVITNCEATKSGLPVQKYQSHIYSAYGMAIKPLPAIKSSFMDTLASLHNGTFNIHI